MFAVPTFLWQANHTAKARNEQSDELRYLCWKIFI